MSSGQPQVSLTAYNEGKGYPFVADSPDHWYCFYNISSTSFQNKFHQAMDYLNDETDMSDIYTTNCGLSTDVIFIEDNDLDAFGRADCFRFVSGDICDQFWVQINPTWIASWLAYFEALDPGDDFAPYNIHLIKTIRHEAGHTTGLSHHSRNDTPLQYSAMRSGLVEQLSYYNFVWAVHLPHHIDHIDEEY